MNDLWIIQNFAWPFYEPVDVEGLKIYDYYDIVSHPMDLSTIKKKMDFKQYANAQEVADDIRLVREYSVKLVKLTRLTNTWKSYVQFMAC